MMSRICLLSSAYLAPVQYYTKLYAYAEAYVDVRLSIDRCTLRTSEHHRCTATYV